VAADTYMMSGRPSLLRSPVRRTRGLAPVFSTVVCVNVPVPLFVSTEIVALAPLPVTMSMKPSPL
jgi:hypothetical protein